MPRTRLREKRPRAKTIRGTIRDRIFAKFILAENGCWLWTASLDETGHAQITLRNKSVRVHRWMYENYRGPIPEGKELHHECFTPSCINPWHVEPKTSVEHNAEHAKAFCVNGHEFTEENTKLYKRKDGNAGRMLKRICLACNRIRTYEYWLRNKQLVKERRQQRRAKARAV